MTSPQPSIMEDTHSYVYFKASSGNIYNVNPWGFITFTMYHTRTYTSVIKNYDYYIPFELVFTFILLECDVIFL